MAALTDTTLIAINNEVIHTQIDDEIVMISPNDDKYFGVNSVGAEIWQFLASKPANIEALANHIQNRYLIEKEQALNDVKIFIEGMLKEKFFIMV